MKKADGILIFGEWFADLPELDNPGLTEANNVIWTEGGYEPYHPLTQIGGGLPAQPNALFKPFTDDDDEFYAATLTQLYEHLGTNTWTLRSSATYASSFGWKFAQFDNLVIAADPSNAAQVKTLNASTSFTLLATSGTAPPANAIGVVGRFVVLGSFTGTVADTATIQWSAIDSPRNWPTPGTSTAVATQSGKQVMPAELGAVTGVYGTDQFGVVFQTGGISRMTYIGGDIVFQFNLIDNVIGSPFPKGIVKVGGLVYFPSRFGFHATDGVSVHPIGKGKVDEYFAESLDWNQATHVTAGYDRKRDLIYWAYPTSSATSGRPNKVLIFHRPSGRWTSADQELWAIGRGESGNRPSSGATQDLYSFDRFFILSQFNASAGSATFTTAEMEHNRGGYSLVQGVKPLVQGTAPAVTVAIGTRNDQNPANLTYTAARTATASTGFADFRSSARYHRARITVTGEFESATGIEWQAAPQGAR